jgi:serine/threonine-protein kinase
MCPQDGTPLRLITELPEGTVIRGKYRILSKLGEGGMGVVYKARHVRFDEVWALKLVSTSLLEDPTFLQRFNAEAVLMRKLDHPNALRVHDIDETEDGRPFIVMEYVEGRDLASLLADGPMDPVRAARIVMQACEALGAAHRLGIIHRDIKPTNIMVSRGADGGDHAKVFDFGIAKVKEGSPLGGASLTQTGMIVGTPAYMSPEQAQGLRGEKLDGRTDLYSLGIVLYEMLTGSVPFTGETPMQLLLAHVQNAPPDPRTIRAELPAALAEIVLRALEKDPAKRFANAAEMRDALAAAVADLEALRNAQTRVQTPVPAFSPAATARVVTPQPSPAPPAETKRDTPVPPVAPVPTERVVTPRPVEREPLRPPATAQPKTQAHPPSVAESPPAPTPKRAGTHSQPASLEPATWTAQPRIMARWIYAAAGSLAVVALLVAAVGRWGPSSPGIPAPSGTTPAPRAVERTSGPRTTQLVVETSPGAQVYLDNAFKGLADASGRLVVDSPTPGEHSLRMVLPGKKEHQQQVKLANGQTAMVIAALTEPEGPPAATGGDSSTPRFLSTKRIAVVPENPSTQEIKRLMAEANKALDEGRYDEAIRGFRGVLALDRANKDAQQGLREAESAKAAEESVLKKKP